MTRVPALPLAGVAAVLLASTAAFPAHAATDVTLPNGCVIVADPNPEQHTVCTGMTFDVDDALPGANLDYADLSGSTITSALLSDAASARHLTLDDVDYLALTPVLAAGTPGSIDSAVDARLGAGAATVLAGAPQDLVDLRGADLRGAVIDGWAVYLDATGADLTGAQLGHLDAASSQVLFANFTDANLTGAVFAAGAASGPADHDFTGATVDGLTLPRSLGGSIMSGIDWTQATFRAGTNFGGARLDEAVLEGVELAGPVHWGGVSARGLRAAGVAFTGGLDGGGVDLTDADLAGAVFVDAALPGLEALRADFTGASFTGSLNLAGANLTSTTWQDVTGLDTVTGPHGGAATQIFPGVSFAHADLTGVSLPLAGGMWLTDVTAAGATFLVTDPHTGKVLFHDANLAGANFIGGGGLGGSQFHRATLTGASLDVALDGAVFVGADLRGAKIQPITLRGVGGLTVVDSDLTGATLPPVDNDPTSPGRWMYGLKIVDTDLAGTALAPRDVRTTTTGLEPAAVDFVAGPGWANDQGQDGPYPRILDTGCDYAAGRSVAV